MTDLTQGKIYSTLSKLALPIMATGFVQMSYNFMDLLWLGRLSTAAVTAAGTVGFFGWLGIALAMMPSLGAQISVADTVGRKDDVQMQKFISNALKLATGMGVLYMLFLYLFKIPLISFFNLSPEINPLAYEYMNIYNLMSLFMFLNPIFSGISNGMGDSKTPFLINSIGLVINIVLDPVLIFGWWIFPEMGIRGAAIATVLAQAVVTAIFIITRREYISYLRHKLDAWIMRRLISIGLPISFQECTFAFISMVMASIIAHWGTEAVAAQKIGVQIESITWQTIEGFSIALSAFIAQNKGAGKFERIREGYRKAMQIVIIICIATSFLLYVFAPTYVRFFTPNDAKTIHIGVQYLRIMSLSQVFLGLEIANQGALNGLGKTIIPATNGIILTALRIPFAYLVYAYALSLDWIWMDITISCILKGSILFMIFYFRYYKKNKF